MEQLRLVMTKFELTKPDGTKLVREHLVEQDDLKWTTRQYAEVNEGVCTASQDGKTVYQFPEKQ